MKYIYKLALVGQSPCISIMFEGFYVRIIVFKVLQINPIMTHRNTIGGVCILFLRASGCLIIVHFTVLIQNHLNSINHTFLLLV